MNELKAPSLQSLLESERGSTDSLLVDSLNIEDLDDIEYSIPPTDTLPTLESVLSAFEVDSDVVSELGIPSATPTPSIIDDGAVRDGVASIMRYTPLHGVSAQLTSAAERVNSGTATACAISDFFAIGTSHGHLLNFDVTQTLRWAHQDKTGQGALSSLAFNMDCTRLLAGYSRGLITMFDCHTGNPLRNLNDAVAPNSGVLHVKWSSRSSLALCADTGGSVWALSFTRKLGIRSYNSRCLFSGARGEVCTVEPLLMDNHRQHEIDQYCIVALATLSKYFIVTIRPRLKVIKYHMLQGPADCLPLLGWQWVLIQAADATRSVDPVLVVGRGNQLFFHQLFVSSGRITLLFLRHVQMQMNLLTCHWLGPKCVATLDTSEVLHLIDVRTTKELECIDVANAGVVYGSAQFKGLATGSNVSPAFALAGTNACYNSVVSHGAQLYILGARTLHVISVRTWSERISYLVRNQRWQEACHLALDGYFVSADKPRKRTHAKERILMLCKEYMSASVRAPEYCLGDIIKCIITIGQTNLLWTDLWPNLQNKDLFLQHISEYIENEQIRQLNPIISQALVDYWLKQSPKRLEQLILKLDWTCLDLNQVLKAVKKHELYRAQMYLNTKALSDYTGVIVELIPHLNVNDTELGNCLLVYISGCLAGRSYPNGDIPLNQVAQVKGDVLRYLTSPNSKLNETEWDSEPKYPYLNALLKFDTRETLNVISLAFQEHEFNNESGFAERKRIVNILLEIMAPANKPAWAEIGCLLNFIAQQISMQNLPLDEDLLKRVLSYLSQEHVDDESVRQHSEREGAWHELLNNNCLATIVTDEEQLELAKKAQCYYVMEYLLEKLQRYENIIECYTRNPQRHDTLFVYLERHVKKPERKIYDQIRRYLNDLLKINAKETTRIIALHFVKRIDDLLQSLAGDELTMFLLLRNLNERKLHMITTQMEVLVELYCKYENQAVVQSFLQSSNGYRLDHALRIALKYNLSNVVVYLAEEQGNFHLAFERSMDILCESENEEIATLNAKKMSSLLARAAKVMPTAQLESCWFTLLKYILPRPELRPITKSMLYDASQHIDLHNLVQLVLNTQNVSGNFGDIKHLIMSMLTNSRQKVELLRMKAQRNALEMHEKFAQRRREACRGLWITMMHCAVCQARLCGQSDFIIVLGPCGHVMHDRCLSSSYADDAQDDDDKTNMRCPRCLLQLAENVVKNPLVLCKTSHTSFPKETKSHSETSRQIGVLQLKAPPRRFC